MNAEARAALRQIGEGFIALSEALAVDVDQVEVTPGVELAPEPEIAKPKISQGEANRRKLRDWVAARGDEPFTKSEAAEGVGMRPNSVIGHLRWALDRGIIERAGRRPADVGRPAELYRYRRRVPEGKHRLVKGNGSSHPGAEAVAGTGKSGVAKGAHREVREMVAALRSQGFKVTETKGGHVKVRDSADKLLTTLPSTPSDHRAMANARARLRREGAKL